jgi:hypothetical protein
MDELIAPLKLLFGHSDRAAVVKLMKEHAGGLHQAVFQEGFDTGYGKSKGELDTAKASVTDLTGKLTAKEQELKDAQKAHPDVGKIHEQYQGQIAQLTTDFTGQLATAKGQVKSKEQTRAKAELKSLLVSLGVHPAMASVQVELPDHASRLVVDDAGELQVLQPGMTIPFAPAGEKTPLRLLAETIRAKVEPQFIVSGADGGSGGGGTDGGAAPTGLAAVVTNIKKKAEDARKAEQAASSSGVPDALKGMAVTSS